MPITSFIWAPSGTGLSEHAWATAEELGAAWVGNDAAAHITLLRHTVRDELAFGMEQRGVSAAHMAKVVDEALAVWGLESVAGRDPARISSGQTRRLAIAAAVATAGAAERDDVPLVLDCPCDGLDLDAVRILKDVLAAYPGDVIVYDRMHTPLAETAARVLRLDAEGALHEEPAPTPTVNGPHSPRIHTVVENSTPVISVRNLVIDRDSTSFQQSWGGEWGSAWRRIAARLDRGRRRRKFARGGAASQVSPEQRRRTGVVGPISLEAFGGSIVHVVGANGTGKTSLFLALLGFAKVVAGTVVAPPNIGWVPAGIDRAITKHTVRAEIGGTTDGRALELLDAAGLGQWADTHPLDAPLSVQRLVVVLAAIATEPDVLLLDEPTIGLDSAGHELLAALLRDWVKAQPDRVVLMASHNHEYAEALSDVTVNLNSDAE